MKMPANNAYPDLIADSESLLSSSEQNAKLLPGSEPLREGLEGALSAFKSVKALQENLEGNRQASTQRLKDAAELVREAARRLRGFVKAHLGTKNEHLVQFGIAPIRSRRNRVKNPKPPAPEAPQAAVQPVEQDAEKAA
jgi:hypothetical protein